MSVIMKLSSAMKVNIFLAWAFREMLSAELSHDGVLIGS